MGYVRVSSDSGSVVVSGGGHGVRGVSGVAIMNGSGNGNFICVGSGPRLPYRLRRRVKAWALSRGVTFDHAVEELVTKGLDAETEP